MNCRSRETQTNRTKEKELLGLKSLEVLKRKKTIHQGDESLTTKKKTKKKEKQQKESDLETVVLKEKENEKNLFHCLRDHEKVHSFDSFLF